MAGFTKQAFEKKLLELNSSQQSIQTLSLWLIHHRKHYKTVVQTWFGQLMKAKPARRLTFMYLANDVIQNSRKKGPEFSKEFLTVLEKAFGHISKEIEPATLASLDRLLKIWEERAIYEKSQIAGFKKALHSTTSSASGSSNTVNNGKSAESETKKSGTAASVEPSAKITKGEKRKYEESQGNGHIGKKFSTEHIDPDVLNNMMTKIGSLVEETPVDMDKYEPIEPEKLIQTLQSLENCASADVDMRKKIASLPPEIFDVKLFENILQKDTNEDWSKLIDEAQKILTTFNTRLAKELEDRKQLSSMLVYFIESQRRALSQAEQSLSEYRDKLRKVISVREELNSHLKNLPDLSQLPSVTPLPSALDLFKL